ncbi:MAG TPA: preprotein translocase subunit SecG [Thermodesulfobacteriota bacterium]|nr:preprotein translocase subunit SecG [Thermodesulfobacteriota bacterium]
MSVVIVFIHVIVSIALICIVLLQTSKGASLGAAFGGSTQTVFGASGSASFFEKMTTVVAIIFMITSLSLTYISAKRGGRTIMKEPVTQEQPAPVAPEQALPPDAAQQQTPAQPEPATQPAEPAAPTGQTPAPPLGGQTAAPESSAPAPDTGAK